MKRNKTNRTSGGGGVSPYAKYDKVPYRYSEAYYKWRASIGAPRQEKGPRTNAT